MSEFETESVDGGRLQMGDEILVKLIVTDLRTCGNAGRHHVMFNSSDSSIQMGDQFAWTWGWPMASKAKPFRRIVKNKPSPEKEELLEVANQLIALANNM